jgi:steroid delta-isomerase-like uncharacterized protein
MCAGYYRDTPALTLLHMNQIETKQQLLDSLIKARMQVEAFVASLTREQLTQPRDAAGWAVKDHLAHLAVWQNGMTALLRHQARWEAMGFHDDSFRSLEIDELNDAIFQQHKDKPVDQVLAMFADTHTRFMIVLDALSDEDLHKIYSHYQPDEPGEDSGEPILNWVVGNTSHHFMEHLPWMQQIVSPNAALIRQWAEAWMQGDTDALAMLFKRDYTVNGKSIGVEGVKQAVRMLHTAFAPVVLTLNEFVVAGDRIAVRWTMAGTHNGEFMGITATGKPVTLSGINIYRIEDERIAENHEQVGMEALLNQLRAS